MIWYRTVTYYRLWPYYQIPGGFREYLYRMRLANRGRLLLRTPVPVTYWTCICSNVKTFFPERIMLSDFIFRTSLSTSFLLLHKRKSPYTHRQIQNATWQHKNATKNFDYTTIADRFRTVSWSNDSHPTGIVKPVYEIPTFPLTATAV